ncbi:MAG: hypothetical protein V1692_01310 [bacterium]
MKNQLLKTKIITLSILLFLFIVAPLSAASLDDWDDELINAQGETGYKPAQAPEDIVGAIIKTALSLVGVIFLILIIYGGFLWMTAGGKEDQIKKAQNIIQNSVIGLAIVLAAYGITYFVIEQLTTKTGYTL